MCSILGSNLGDTETKNSQVIFQSNHHALDKRIVSEGDLEHERTDFSGTQYLLCDLFL